MIKKFLNILNFNNPVITMNQKKIIFIHINKTAGTSILDNLKINKKQHYDAKEIIEKIGYHKWIECYKFSFVRNPWDKVVSHYFYRVKTNQCNMQSKKISFKDWVNITYGSEKDLFYYDNKKMFQSQSDWLKDSKGEISIDFIGKFENLNKDFKKIQDYIGIQGSLPHKNIGIKKDYRKMYDSKSFEIINNWFAEDIDKFNYSFES